MIGTFESPLVERLYRFVDTSRSGVTDFREANIRPQGIVRLATSLQRLYAIADDYQTADGAFLDHHKRQQELFASHPEADAEGSRDMTPDEIQLMVEGGRISLVLHLRIETFYLFAKILLDEIPKAIEGFFGQCRSLSMGSHSKLVKRLPEYADAKGLTPPPPNLMSMADEAQRRISDYRDHHVTHVESLRTMKGTLFDIDSGAARISVGRMLPKESDTRAESEPLPTLLAFIESYVGEVLPYIEAHASAPWDRPSGT